MATPEELARIEAGPKTPAERIWFDKYSHDRLQAWRQVQDPEADACTEQLEFQKPTGLLSEVERRAREEGGVFQAFLDHCYTVPEWVDFDLMELGIRMYRRYSVLQGLVLMCSSLVEGYAHNKPAQVLVSTGRLQKDVSRRIYETGQMLHNMVGPDGIRPGSVGHRTLMEVRLLHSAVRQFLKRQPERFDTARYDLPINQEDMAGTVLEFDFMVVRGLKKLGCSITREQHEAMHYLWRYAGYVLGVREELLTSTLEEQEVLALQLTTHLYSPTRDSEALAKALLKDMSNRPPFRLSYDALLALSRYLIGDKVADDLNINSSMSSRAAIQALRGVVGTMTRVVPMLPDPVLKRMEAMNFSLGRKVLSMELGDNPATWGFKAIA